MGLNAEARCTKEMSTFSSSFLYSFTARAPNEVGWSLSGDGNKLTICLFSNTQFEKNIS